MRNPTHRRAAHVATCAHALPLACLLACLCLLLPLAGRCQSLVAITAQVTGSNGAPFEYGTYQVQLVDSSGNPVSFTGSVTAPSFSGALDATGSLSLSLYPNSAFAPPPGTTATYWKFRICSAANYIPYYVDSYQQCFSSLVTVTSAGSYSAVVSSGAPAVYWQDMRTGTGYFNSQIATSLQAGATTPLPGAVISASQTNVGTTTQITVQNTSSDNAASSDFVANSDNATNTAYYADFGCNSSTYNQAAYNSGGANDCYVYASNGNFNIATAAAGKLVTINVGGTTAAQTVATFLANGEQVQSLAGTGTAAFVAGAAAGTSPGTPACATSHVCDTLSGVISLTVGTATTTGVLLTVTSPVTHTNQLNCDGSVYLVASPYTMLPLRITETTTTYVFNVGTAPTASTAYELAYQCLGNWPAQSVRPA